VPITFPLILGGGSLVGIILIFAFGIDRLQRPPTWFWFLCAIPLSAAAMLGTIWALRHGYLSIASDSRMEFKIIMWGLLVPFLAVLMAIIAFFTKDWPKE
jgi:hypothetical protein